MFVDVFFGVEILGYFSELDVVHHVIFIGEWLEETATVKGSEHARACVCVSSGLVNKCMLFSIWGSLFVVVTYTSGRERGPYDVTVAGLCVLVGVSVYIFCLRLGTHRSFELSDLPVFMPVSFL